MPLGIIFDLNRPAAGLLYQQRIGPIQVTQAIPGIGYPRAVRVPRDQRPEPDRSVGLTRVSPSIVVLAPGHAILKHDDPRYRFGKYVIRSNPTRP